MQIKAVTVLALALVADSANASLWNLWKSPNAGSPVSVTTDGALSEPTVELPSADSSASPVIASELTVPEINVLAPKGSSQEQQQEDQESFVEPAQEVPEVEGAPADQEAGRSFLGRLNPRNWFSRNDSTTKPDLVVKIGEPIRMIPQQATDASLTEAGQSLDEEALPSTDGQEGGKSIASDLANQLENVSLSDVAIGKDELDASSTEETSDEESEGEEEN